MARTKHTPTKEREGKTVLRTREERARLAREARGEGSEESRRRMRRLARRVRKENVEKQPPSLVHHPSPAKSPLPTREVMQVMKEMMGRVEEASKLEAVGRSPSSSPTRQLAQMAAEARPSALGGSLPEGSSIQLLEAKPHERNSRRQERSKRPGSTGLAQLPSARSGGIRRVLNSSLGNSPSHG